MPQYLLSIYQPDGDGDPPPPEVLERIMQDVNAVRQQMQAAGVWVFSAGLHAPSSATVVRAQGAEILTIDGPFTEAKEHLGGLSIIAAPDLDAALGWARKLATAITPLPVEVRSFQEGGQ